MVDRPFRIALAATKSAAMALLVVAAAFAPSGGRGDLEQAVALSLDHDRSVAQDLAGTPVGASGDASRAAQPDAAVEPAGAPGAATSSARPLPPTDTLP